MIARRQIRALPSAAVCVAVLVAVLVLAAAAAGVMARAPLVWGVLIVTIGLVCLGAAVGLYLAGARPLPTPLEQLPATRAITLNWLAPWYDSVCSALGLGAGFKRFLLDAARVRSGDRVLDLGCATGVFSQLAAQAAGSSGEVWGVDPAPDMVRLAAQSGSRLKCRAQFRPAVPERLPFADTSFDVVVSNLLLCRLPAELKGPALAEARRVLKPGGRLVVVDLDAPSRGSWKLLGLPLQAHGCTAAHIRGRTGAIVEQAGFARPRRAGRWGPISAWEAARG